MSEKQEIKCDHEWYETRLDFDDVLVWCFKCGKSNSEDEDTCESIDTESNDLPL